MFNLENKVVLVTGSARGLGLALVKELSARKLAKIYASCRNQADCDAIDALKLVGVESIVLDVLDPAQIQRCSKNIPHLDLLINNAGIASACGYSSENAMDNARAEMDLHYFGSLSMVHAFLPQLKSTGQSGIINISSIAGLSNFKTMGTYSASKSAQRFLTQGLRAELADDGIFVQGVYPGPFKTRLSEGFDGEKPEPSEIALKILDAFSNEEEDVFPDSFSAAMSEIYLNSPKELGKTFSNG